MGLFSGSKKTYVGTSVSRAIEDDLLPNSIKQATVHALHTDSDVLESISNYLTSSVGVRAEKMYKYGESKYIFGNPSGEFTSASVAPRVIESILREHFNDPLIVVNYSKFGQLNLYHLAWKRVVETYDYNSNDHTLNIKPQHYAPWPVILEDIRVDIPKAELEAGHFSEEATEMWEKSPRYRATELGGLGGSGLGSPYFLPMFRWNAKPGLSASLIWTYEIPMDFQGEYGRELEIPEEYLRTVAIPIADYDYEGEYFQAKYTRDGRQYFWTYKIGSGTYPELDTYFESAEQTQLFGEFYPFAYFRTEKRSMAENKNSEEYKSSKKITSILGINYDDVHDAVHENPDIGDIEQAFMYFGVPGVSEHPLENRYLFEFFDKMYYFQDNQFQRPEEAATALMGSWISGLDMNQANAIIIQDQKFKMTLQNRGIYKQRRAGTIGEIGTYTSEFKKKTVAVWGIDPESGQPQQGLRLLQEHIYRKQIGTGIHEEIRVMSLSMRYHVWGNYSTVGDEEDEILLIPLEKSIMETMTIPQKEMLFSRALHYVFNSRITIKTKWYQSGFFQFVITVAAVVISIVTMNPGVVAAATATFATAMVALGKFILQAVIMSLVFKLVVDIIGIEFAIVLAVIAAAYGMYDANSSGGLANAPWARELLNAAVGLVNAAGESVAESIKLLQEDMTNFLADAKEQMKLLDEANDLLKPTTVLSPFVYLGESAEAFYNRTIRSGNVGVMAIEAQSLFVDQAIRLPTIQDTIGSDDYDI